MKIRQKLVLGFSAVAVLLAAVGYVYAVVGQGVMRDEIGEGLEAFAEDVLLDIDRRIDMRIETVQGYCKDRFMISSIERSNEEFEKLSDIKAYIYAMDQQWTSVQSSQTTEFMKELSDNQLSQDLRKRLNFHNSKNEYPVFIEAFLTNKYGAVIAQDKRTTDYYQADEIWWQQARQNGLYVGDVEYDKSSLAYCLPICIAINDTTGKFAGVFKVALNIEDTYAFLGEELTFDFKLLDARNRIIYSTDSYTFLEDINLNHPYAEILAENIGNGWFVVSEKDGDCSKLISIVSSTGYKDYNGAGWKLLLEHDTCDVFASADKLKNWQLFFSCLATLLSLIFGVFLSKSISEPIIRLAEAAGRIGKGDLNTVVEINTEDETGLLADAFNKMVADLKTSTASIDVLNGLNAQLQQSQKEIQNSNIKLKDEIEGRKRIQENLKFSNAELEKTIDKLAHSNQELQDFVYIASHDLREPLRKISSFGQMLQDSIRDNLSGDDLENLEFMIDGATRMTQMIEALLVYSRLNTKGAEFGTADLNVIIDQLQSLEIAAIIEDTNARLIVPQKLPSVVADVAMLRQLIQNLVINGIKYRAEGVVPEIVITACDVDEDTVKILISDNGIGIKEELHETIFKMFKRAHSRQKYEGTGIGLAVCRKIVEKHGGTIGVDSAEGQGSVFWFTINKAKEAVLV